jgi:membrane-bound metal-dependent hydrolase YbcI (DUF457 family)
MPSTVVHVALGLLLAAGVLGRRFDKRAMVVVAVAVVVPDLDVFASFLIESTHRAMLHSLLVPGALAGLLAHDTRVRDRSWVAERYGTWGVQVAWTALLAGVVAGVGLDAFTPLGVNLLYPVHDQFVSINGEVYYSTVDGFVQTFVDVSRDAGGDGGGGGGSVDVGQRGSTDEVHVGSGVDPEKGTESPGTKRVFPVAFRGWHLTLLLTSIAVVAVRLRRNRLAAAATETVTGEVAEPETTD